MRALLLVLLGVSVGLVPAGAIEADQLARIHHEAIGGAERLENLTTLRARGYVRIDNRYLQFTLLAERPNRVRMETHTLEHVIVQATDGVNPPWQMDPRDDPPKPRLITGTEAREFAADAEFDDPLVNSEAKGYSVEFAGETEWDERPAIRLLLTRRLVDSFYLFIDPETFFIVGKQAVRRLDYGREVKMESFYRDFRPVGGVIMPHRIQVSADGKFLHETVMQKVEPNVPLPPGSFTMPKVPLMTEKRPPQTGGLPAADLSPATVSD